MTASLLEWAPPLTLTYGLSPSDLRAMTLAEIDAYVEYANKRTAQQSKWGR